MNPDRIIELLAKHAGYCGEEEGPSYSFALHRREEGSRDGELTALSEELLTILVAINLHWNSSNPEEIEGKKSELERKLVGPVVTIVREGFDFVRAHPTDVDAARAISRISTAWQAVLDGDIADLRQHVKDCEATSGQ